VSRRASGRADSAWQHGALVYDPAAKSARWRGEPVNLTSREMALLEVFLANPSRVLSRPQILERLYGWDEDLGSNALEVFVHHLRRKISANLIRTVRGVGYALGPPENE
jgi:two-component system response regulator QseB